MSSRSSGHEYIRAEQRIYEVATDKDQVNWKSFLYELIYREGLNPWDIELAVLTKKYLEAIKDMKDLDFDVSGKFLTIAIYLLKVKAENYIDHDLRGIEQKIEAFQHEGDDIAGELDALEEFDGQLEDLDRKRKREEYSIKVRNPIARKRKVNIFDLISVLEKTFEQSNRRKANFFARNRDVKYDGPHFEKKPKDLKEIIEELYDIITQEFENKKGHVTFSHLTRDAEHKKGVLEKFLPLLHLHNQQKVEVKQQEHFGEIEIHKVNK